MGDVVGSNERKHTRRRKGAHSGNPLVAGIKQFLNKSGSSLDGAGDVLPKRYTLYEPLLLLSVNFATINVTWEAEYRKLESLQKQEMFKCIADTFTTAGHPVTHIAINAPIDGLKGTHVGLPNVMRCPTGLCPVLGDWGPPSASQTSPTLHDFREAFWVLTVQDHGISQVWAPRWTMFSHGNLSEKKRVLGDLSPRQQDIFHRQAREEIARMQVLDMYIGIGYFALCYLARGVHRVWGWDLNPWSIEGLRRGCEANGWRCTVLEVATDGSVSPSIQDLVMQLRQEEDLPRGSQTRCVAFHGNNEHAIAVAKAIEEEWKCQDSGYEGGLRFDHINLGLLPQSVDSWERALQLVTNNGRLHLHANVEAHKIDATSPLIKQSLEDMSQQIGRGYTADVMHVERVKSYGPATMHCVFDISLSQRSS